jgi:hypothetical protein
MRVPMVLGVFGVLGLSQLGCESQSSSDMRARQDEALRDPWSYGPSVPTTGPSKLDNGEYDVRDSRGLKSDLKRLFQ